MTDAPQMGFSSKIAPELEMFRRPIGDAKLHPDNVRKHSIEKIAQSLEAHGQRALIIVHVETGYIVKGNGTQTAAQLLGWTETAQVWQSMSDEEAMAFLYADNRASDLATYDRKKLRDGLAAMVGQPGFFDTLWSIEEFEDLDEELAGSTILEPTESKAEFATADGGEIKHERAALPGEKMREVPMVLTIADYDLFKERLAILQKAFGTGGSIVTILEAVKRQADLEMGDGAQLGKVLTDDEVYAIKREVVKELRDYFLALGPDQTHSGTQVAARLETVIPYRQSVAQASIAEGQIGIMDEATPVLEGVTVISAEGTTTGTVMSDDSIRVDEPDEPEADLTLAPGGFIYTGPE